MKLFHHAKTTLTILALWGLAVTPVVAQHEGHDHPAPAISAPTTEDSPGFVFYFIEHDFGAIHQGQSPTVEFPFVNKSGKTITIENIRTTCGCTAAALEKRTFEPGEGEKIGVTFNSAGRTGAQHKVVTIATNDPDHPAYQLKVAANVVTEMELSERVVNFGAVQEGEGAAKEIALFAYAKDPVEIKKIDVHAQGIEVSQGEPEEHLDARSGRKGRKFPLTVTVKPDYPAGRLAGSITITTNHPQEAVHSVAVTGLVRGEIAVSPNQVFFGVLGPNSDAERVVRLMVRENQTFEMTGYTLSETTQDNQPFEMSDHVDVKLTTSDANPEVQLLSVYFKTPEERGTYKGIITTSGTVGEKKVDFNVPFQVVIRPEMTQGAAADPGAPSAADVISGRATLPAETIRKQQEEQRKKLIERRLEMEQRLEQERQKAEASE